MSIWPRPAAQLCIRFFSLTDSQQQGRASKQTALHCQVLPEALNRVEQLDQSYSPAGRSGRQESQHPSELGVSSAKPALSFWLETDRVSAFMGIASRAKDVMLPAKKQTCREIALKRKALSFTRPVCFRKSERIVQKT